MEINDTGTYTAVFDAITEGLYLVDLERRINYWNKAAEEITGFSAQEVMGYCCADNILCHVDKSGNELCRGLCPLAATMRDGVPKQTEIFLHHKEGYRLAVSVRTSPLTNDTGAIIGAMELFSPITPHKPGRLQFLEAQHQELVDSLTGLPTEQLLHAEIDSDLYDLSRNDYQFGIIIYNVDNMAEINNRHGHATGDRILYTVGNTLSKSARLFDTVGRLEGDEFLGIYPTSDIRTLKHMAENMRALVEKSFSPGRWGTITATVSCGGTLALLRDDVHSLLNRARGLLRNSKLAGGNYASIDTDDDMLNGSVRP